jgi:chromosomal replication initiator protein
MANPDRAVWADILSYLRGQHPDMCRQWFEDIEPLGTDEGVFKLRVHQAVHQRYLQRQCAQQFTEALQSATGRLMAVRFLGPADEVPAPAHNGHAPADGVEIKPRQPAFRPVPPNGSQHHEGLVISPDNSFENFVVGPETRLAHAAAKAVAEQPGRAYNPLFIHGGVGLGKTHLLQAICQTVMMQDPDASIYYISCESFMTQFMEAVQAGQMHEFRHRFRHLDMLFIDDIHFLAKRDHTQEEFFHTFNSLYQADKQIVLSSDAPPHEIPDLEARLVSRFQCGLVVEVNPPGYDTRVQIVKQKARLRGLDFPDDAACTIAAQINSNIRELEGAIIRVQMLAQTDGKPINEALVRQALDQPGHNIRPEITIDDIIEVVIQYYGVKLTDLQSKRRQKSIAFPRQVCMFLARRLTRYSFEEIGGYFGGRDHTTVMHAVRTVDAKRSDDDELHRVLTALEQKLGVAEPADAA